MGNKKVLDLKVGNTLKKKTLRRSKVLQRLLSATFLGWKRMLKLWLWNVIAPICSQMEQKMTILTLLPRMYSATSLVGEGETYQVVDDDFQVT